MTHHHSIAAIILCALMAMAATGCRSHKSVAGAVPSSASDVELFGMLAGEYSDYTDLYLPVNIALKAPADMSISGRATFVRDKEIFISLRVFGMEVANVYANTDSLFIVDKYHKMYFSESLARLLGDVPLTIGNLQDLLLGRPCTAGGGTLTPADLTEFTLGGKPDLTIASRTRIHGTEWSYTATRTEPVILTALTLTPPSGAPVVCAYGAPGRTPAGFIASGVAADIPLKSTAARIEIGWGVDDAKCNTGRTISFNPPSGYKRIEINSLLKSLNNQ